METDLRAGDVVRVSCPFTATRVTGRTGSHVLIEWPWREAGLGRAECYDKVAIEADPGSSANSPGLFRLAPAAGPLSTGDPCRVGIPPTLLHVTAIEHCDPPPESGLPSDPRRNAVLLPVGRSDDPDLEDRGYFVDLDRNAPVRFEPLFRPYERLVAGDEVADAAGRAWRFDGPWSWSPFDGGGAGEPVWPLTLLTRDGVEDEEAAAAVADATRTGSHRSELARWTALTRAEPV